MEAYKILTSIYNGFRLANLSKKAWNLGKKNIVCGEHCTKIQMILSNDSLRNSGILVLLNKEEIPELHNSEILFSLKIPSYKILTKS